MTKRARENDDISSRYELTSFITNSLNKNYINKLKLGDTKILFNYLKDSEKISTNEFSKYLAKVNQSEKETITDQLFTMILNDSFKSPKNSDKLNKYFKRSLGTTTDVSGFECFVKSWIILEKAVSTIHRERNRHHKKFFTAKFEPLAEDGIISNDEAVELNYFKRVRNNLLHGVETPNDEELNVGFLRLIALTEKVISAISDEVAKEDLLNQVQLLRN